MREYEFPKMRPEDWQQCRESIGEHVRLYHMGPSLLTELFCTVIAVFTWWKFGIHSFCGITGVLLLAWLFHRIFRAIALRNVLFEGYEIGFEAGQLAAKGIPMQQYLEHLQRMRE
jgi:hypothetical protein